MTVRFVPLDRFLLDRAVDLERDPLTAEMASGDGFAERVLPLRGLSVGVLDGGNIVGAGGLVPLWPGRAEGWWLVSRQARPRQLAQATRLAVQLMDRRQRDPTFRRIEAWVRADAPYARSFLKALGFAAPSLQPRWDTKGRDHLFAYRIREN